MLQLFAPIVLATMVSARRRARRRRPLRHRRSWWSVSSRPGSPSEADRHRLIQVHGVPQIIAANAAVASDPNPDPGVRSDVIYEIQRRLVPYLSYMRRALLLPSLDAGQRATLSELLDRSERKCAEFEASLRQAWVDSGLIMHGAPPSPALP